MGLGTKIGSFVEILLRLEKILKFGIEVFTDFTLFFFFDKEMYGKRACVHCPPVIHLFEL